MIDLRSKRVLVTGGGGFLGGHILEELARRGCERVIAPRRAEFDLTNAHDVQALFRGFRPEVVIHAAAVVGGIGANRNSPGRFFYENILMGVHLIEAARRFALEKVVVLGTICAYPKFTPIPFSENNLWEGYPEETNAPYGIAKKALLVQCQAYRDQYGLNAVYLLPVNLYGPRDNFDPETSHVIPALIRKCSEAAATGASHIVCWGDGTPTREFLYVRDAAEGIVRAAESYDGREPINLGSGREVAIRSLARTIADLTGFHGSIEWDASRPNGQPRRCLDVSRAADLFGFRARTALEEGLRETVEWFHTRRVPAAVAS
jgi:GDP-L-fucose synthase